MLKMAKEKGSLDNALLEKQETLSLDYNQLNQTGLECINHQEKSFIELGSQFNSIPTADNKGNVCCDLDDCNCSIVSDTDSTRTVALLTLTPTEPNFCIDSDRAIWYPDRNLENIIRTDLTSKISDKIDKAKTLDIYDFSENSTEIAIVKPFSYVINTKVTNNELNVEAENNDYTDDSRHQYNIKDKDFDINEWSESENSDSTKNGENSSDKDFNIKDIMDSSDTDSYESTKEHELSEEVRQLNITTEDKNLIPSVSEKLKYQKSKDYRNKRVHCKFCDKDVTSRNFVRHLVRHHNHEEEVKNALKFPVKCRERKQALSLLRNNSNFDLYLKGIIRPKKQLCGDTNIEYYPCVYCRAVYAKSFINRHVKSCSANIRSTEGNTKSKVNHVALSQTVVACALDPTDVISKLDVKNQVFDMMRGDEISFIAKKDLLIVHYGESYLKSQKRERKEYSCSNKIRELSRLLIEYRIIVNDNNVPFKDLLHLENFDKVVSATRKLTGYDPINKSYEAPSVAMHIGTTLKVISDELIHLILKGYKGFQCTSSEESSEWRRNIKNFKKLVEARWNTEISSVANKDLNEKRWQKPLLVPLINDVKIFREETLRYAKNCEKEFLEKTDSNETYKLLVQCTLALLILFNRRRIGDVQYLKVNDYLSERKTDFQDFEKALSEHEKILTKHYKRVVNGGKGSRAVVILVPQLLQHFIRILLENRDKYILSDNQYIFAMPKSKLKWAQGDVAIRNLTNKMKLENAAAISSNRLRKHIATAMQVLSMSKNDCKQFSKFMGHTEKTHEEFYELPIDIYQTAKVVKVLLMMEKGVPSEFKGKSLSEIEVDINEYVENNYPDKQSPDDRAPLVECEELDTNNSDGIDGKLLDKFEHKGIPHKKKKLDTNKKRGWTIVEINLVKQHFKHFIEKSTYPSGSQIKEFITSTNSTRSIQVIKSKIQHLIKLKNKK